MQMPTLPTASYKSDSIGLSTGDKQRSDDLEGLSVGRGSQWEDEEERKFYEDLIDLKDWVPRSFLNIPEGEADLSPTVDADTENADIERLMDAGDEEEGTEYGYVYTGFLSR
jgi:regulator of nonsense transcripts 2